MKRLLRLALCAVVWMLLAQSSACADSVKVCGVAVDSAQTEIDLSDARQTLSGLSKGLSLLPAVQTAQLGQTDLSGNELLKLKARFPDITFHYEIKMYKQYVPDDATSVDLGETTLRDVKKLVSYLQCLPKLESFTAYQSRMSKENMALLTQTFPQVEFHVTLNVFGHLVTTDATSFATLHLETSDRHSDFSILRYCKQLRAIDIGHNKVSDISFLADLPELRVLVLADNRIRDLSPLAGLTKLEYVELFMNKITDISPLSNMPQLLDVNLVFNQIADVSPLTACKKLERAWLGRNPIPESEWETLQSALPDCLFNFTVLNSTGDDWRLHPRHKVKRRIFEGGSYVPWDWTGDE